MGASDFITYEPTRDLRTAFANARDQAAYDYGHAGYTGTIAEKGSTVNVSGLLSLDEAYALADKMIREHDDRISDKWGPAGAIPVTNGTETTGWVFFGWASS
jgi:hypothetical protein